MTFAALKTQLYDAGRLSGAHWQDQHRAAPTIHVRFETFFHPHVTEMIKGMQRDGIPGLLNMANQTLGNAYLHSPWKAAQVQTLSSASNAPACLIESNFGQAPKRPGDFAAVVLEGNTLQHYTHESSYPTRPWVKAQAITTTATGAGCLIQWQGRTTFEVVVLEGDELRHYSNADPSTNQPWVRQNVVSSNASAPGCLIESDFGTLEAVVLEGSNLVHYRLNSATGVWIAQGDITPLATGAGCLIQNTFKSGGHSNFEVVVLEGSQLVHYWKDNASNLWQRAKVITDAASAAGWIMQSRIFDGAQSNFEVVVLEGSQLVHYWKDNSDPGSPWRRGQVITTQASDSGCIVHSTFGDPGNFEVIVPENGRLVHYWKVNGGNVGTADERFYFKATHNPNLLQVDDPYPRHALDFSYGGAYSDYNWELFFHIPMMMAKSGIL